MESCANGYTDAMDTDTDASTCATSSTEAGIDHPADRLIAAIERCKSPVCVGIDPVLERLPHEIRAAHAETDAACQSCCDESSAVQCAVDAIGQFVGGVLTSIAGVVPCVKFQAACYERYGWRGVRQLEHDIAIAAGLGFHVILDAKRGDIGISASHYAASAFDGQDRTASDWITINGYFGRDGIAPFVERSRHGAFVLVRTSNPSGDVLQSAACVDASTIAEVMALHVAEVGEESIGERGFSSIGAVVGATKPDDARRLRTLMPRQLFLVSGYGAQGGGVDDVLPCFGSDGHGAIVTASRSVLYPSSQSNAGAMQQAGASSGWVEAVRDAAEAFAEDVGRATGFRSS